MSEQVRQALAALAKLRAGDRDAILKRLSPDEQRHLAAHKAHASSRRPRPPVTPPTPRPVLPPVSPWLAKHLAQANDGRVVLTPAAREAVRAMLQEPTP